MRTISLYKTDKFEEEFYERYSRFKYGSKTQARIFGKDVAKVCSFKENSNLVFYSAPHNNIHTASHAFLNHLLTSCAEQFMEKNITVRKSKVGRKYSYDTDYGNMTKEERFQAISSDRFSIDKSLFSEEDVLVFVDDIRITGAHESRMLDLIQREGIKNEVLFIYIAEYTGDDPTIEHRLNSKSITNLKDINFIIRNEEFIFNTRVVKYILRADIEEFVSFITYQSDHFRESLFSLSILNSYHQNDKFKTNFGILKAMIK